MGEFKISLNGRVLTVHREAIEVTAISEPDPDWRYTDREGHDHFAAVERVPGDMGNATVIGYPTLVWRKADVETWCPDCQDVHADEWQECRQCGEQVRPGSRMGRPRWLAGMTSYEIDGEPVTADQAREFVTQWQREVNQKYNHDPSHPSVRQAQRLGGMFDA